MDIRDTIRAILALIREGFSEPDEIVEQLVMRYDVDFDIEQATIQVTNFLNWYKG